jgi:iron complex transport system substrate-binding protein
LIRRNVGVHAFNQRNVAGILDMIRTLGALTGVTQKAEALAAAFEDRLHDARERAQALRRRPRVYFEEWDEPMISGIKWVSELIETAGGIEVFPALARCKNAKDRIVAADAVIAAAPDIIVDAIPAVRTGWLREIKSPIILQPGPAALTDGLDALSAMFMEWADQCDAANRVSTPAR